MSGGVYIGAFSVGGCIVGLSGAFGTVGAALTNLNDTVETQLAAIESASALIGAQLDVLLSVNEKLGLQSDAILTAKAAIRIPAIALPSVQVGASADINLQLTADLGDPTAYLNDLIAGLATVEASLEASLPEVQLSETIAANLSVGLDFQAQIDAIDLQLDVLVSINAQIALAIQATAAIQVAIAAQLTAFAAIQAALSAALAAVVSALSTYVSMSDSLATVGGQAFVYTGPLSGLGAGLDAVTPSAGLPGSTNVLCPVMFVQQSDTPAVNATNAVYRTS